MKDSEKDWAACARYCLDKADEVEDGQYDGFREYEWYRMAVCAYAHAAGEGWAWIRKKWPRLTDAQFAWLMRWTT